MKADGACGLAMLAHTQSVLQCCKPTEVSLQYNSNPLMLNGVWTTSGSLPWRRSMSQKFA